MGFSILNFWDYSEFNFIALKFSDVLIKEMMVLILREEIVIKSYNGSDSGEILLNFIWAHENLWCFHGFVDPDIFLFIVFQ